MKFKKIDNFNSNKYEAIHFWNLRLNKLYFKLDEEYNHLFYSKVYSYFKNSFRVGDYLLNISKKYGIKTNPKNLAKRFRNYKSNGWIAGWFLYELAKKVNLNLKKIEDNIILYKLTNGAQMENPKLPIITNPEFYSIVANLMCDGTDRVCRGYRVGRYSKFNSDLMILFHN